MPDNYQGGFMLNWIITFFVLAIIAAFLGFGGLAGTFAQVAQLLTALFVILFLASLVFSLITGRRGNLPPL